MVIAAGFVPSPASATSNSPDVDPVQVTQVLDREVRIPGTAWGVDPAAERVVVSYDDTVTGTELTRLRSVTARFGDTVRMERDPGRLQPLISGGDAIYSGGSRCPLGFNVRNSAGTQYFLTAGHCTNIGSTWYTNTNISKPGNVNLRNGTYQDITSSGTPIAGQQVCHVGPTSGYRCAYPTAVNVTVTYPGGTVYGLYKTNICSEAGDSGGPMFAGTVALGLISGGSGNCTTGGTTYYQPINEPLSVYGVSVY